MLQWRCHLRQHWCDQISGEDTAGCPVANTLQKGHLAARIYTETFIPVTVVGDDDDHQNDDDEHQLAVRVRVDRRGSAVAEAHTVKQRQSMQQKEHTLRPLIDHTDLKATGSTLGSKVRMLKAYNKLTFLPVVPSAGFLPPNLASDFAEAGRIDMPAGARLDDRDRVEKELENNFERQLCIEQQHTREKSMNHQCVALPTYAEERAALGLDVDNPRIGLPKEHRHEDFECEPNEQIDELDRPKVLEHIPRKSVMPSNSRHLHPTAEPKVLGSTLDGKVELCKPTSKIIYKADNAKRRSCCSCLATCKSLAPLTLLATTTTTLSMSSSIKWISASSLE